MLINVQQQPKSRPGNWRLHNERDILKRFQPRTSNLHRLLDDVESPLEAPAIIHAYLDDDWTRASRKQRLTRKEIKSVTRNFLEVWPCCMKMVAILFRAPEVHLEIAWNTAADIWSLGVTLINLIWGFKFHIFDPQEPEGHEMYNTKIVVRQHQWFGPFPISYREIAEEDTQEAIIGQKIYAQDDEFRSTGPAHCERAFEG
ncbi:hypothetical protein TSTA_048200 [Talaromyces stipitatus ATCC 10500]|uniref:Protein kinase domain-containing protein n=1 Tax=Talaromyces stipitatus (strain ATCC 10500 / CBS 375.48 / QM 6759 / NRRL 1006) TaxID=441959 RepID=B8MKM2_TALSN|nr:uncharacterized protein TSTA_048200 [Talaromyces stipitatus ATCC 10500]EED15377.1 hypothetical protein TSTA_048200 [Talaromyces stipitatus ATCC 10500]